MLFCQSAGGDRRYASDAKNPVRLKFDEDVTKENPLVGWPEQAFEAAIGE